MRSVAVTQTPNA